MGQEFETQEKPQTHLSANDDAGSICNGAKGEYMLLWAMLNRAILDACGTTSENAKVNTSFLSPLEKWSGTRKAAAARESARRWIFERGEDDLLRPFSIHWVCQHLSISVERVQREVRLHCNDWAYKPVGQAALCNEQMVNLLLGGER